MVPAAASRTQPFIWLALSLTFINLFDFYQLYLLVAGDPSKRYQTLLTISQFRRRAKKSYKGNLVATNPPGRYNIYLTIYWTLFFHQISSLTHTFTDTQLSPVPIMTSPWESSIVTLSDSHNSVPLAPYLRRQLIFPFKMNLDLKMTHFLACYDKTNNLESLAGWFV